MIHFISLLTAKYEETLNKYLQQKSMIELIMKMGNDF